MNFEELEVVLSEFTTEFECIVLSETWEIENFQLFQLKGHAQLQLLLVLDSFCETY